jgi:hypothetical protein
MICICGHHGTEHFMVGIHAACGVQYGALGDSHFLESDSRGERCDCPCYEPEPDQDEDAA